MKIYKKIISIALVLALAIGMLPKNFGVAAIDITDALFNPNTENLEIKFDLQYTQKIDINITTEPGTLLGALILNTEFSGTDGPLKPREKPCILTLDALNEYENPITNLTIKPVAKSETSTYGVVFLEEAPGKHKIIWDGRLNIGGKEIPAFDPALTGDEVELKLEIAPLGYPERDIPASCTTIQNPDGTETQIHNHGEDWIWTQQFKTWGQISIDYKKGLFFSTDKGAFRELLTNCELKYFAENGQNSNGIFSKLDPERIEGDPVDMLDGNYYFNYTDLAFYGSYPLEFIRMYSSIIQEGTLGQGFSHSYDYKIFDDRGIINVTTPYGEKLIFLRRADSSYKPLLHTEFTLKDNAGGYLLTHKDGAQLIFDSNSRLSRIINPLGINVASMSYAGDLLTKITGYDGTFFQLDYLGNNISSITDSTVRSVTYGYTGNNLTSVTNPDGDTLKYTYDAAGYMSESYDFDGKLYLINTNDAKGRTTEQVFINADKITRAYFEYDDTNLINKYTSPTGEVKTYYFDDYRNLLKIEEKDGSFLTNILNFKVDSIFDKENNEIKYIFNSSDNVTRAIYPNGNIINVTYFADNLVNTKTYLDGTSEQFTYDNLGNPRTYKDRNGHITSYTYNNFFQITKIIDAIGNETNFTYDTHGNLLTETDANGSVLTYSYDNLGRVAEQTDKLGLKTSYTYSPAGKLMGSQTVISPGEIHTQEYKYTGNGFQQESTDNLGNIKTSTYGTNNQILSETIIDGDAKPQTTTYSYDDNGLLSQIVEPSGNTLSYKYNEKGLKSQVIDYENNTTSYEYDKSDRLITEIDALGNKEHYSYDSMGMLKTHTAKNGGITSYNYDVYGRLIEQIDALGGKTSYTYDPNGNTLSVTDAASATIKTEYNAINKAIVEIDALGEKTQYTYDEVGNLKTITDPLAAVQTYEYDKAGNIIAITDKMGYKTQYILDIMGRKTKEINPDGTQKIYEYNSFSQIIKITNEAGAWQTYTYDKMGNQDSFSDALGNKTSYKYDYAGKKLSTLYPDGSTQITNYDVMGRESEIIGKNGGQTRYTYDELGRTKTITNALGETTTYTYDNMGNIAETYINSQLISKKSYDLLGRNAADFDGINSTTYIYDNLGNITEIIDKNGNKTTYEYDKNSRNIKTINAENKKSMLTLDALGRTISKTDYIGAMHSYSYDKNDNILSETDSLGASIENTYDSRGRLISFKDRNGNIEKYEYNLVGDLIKTINAAGKETSYEYDKNSNLIKNINSLYEENTYKYDNMNRKISEKNPLNHIKSYSYDLAGNLVEIIDRNGNKTDYEYDLLDRKIREISPTGEIIEETYNALGKTQSTQNGENIINYSYDNRGFLTQETDALGEKITYNYDNMGNVLTKTDKENQKTTYTYDNLYNLIKKQLPNGEILEYTHDDMGNIIKTNEKLGETNFKYTVDYRLEQVSDHKGRQTFYEYDKNGNKIKIIYPDGKQISYIYDNLNRSCSEIDHDGEKTEHTYDDAGRLIKTLHPDASTTQYAYDKAGLTAKRKQVRADGKTQREITYAYDDEGNIRFEQRTGAGDYKKDESITYTYDGSNKLKSMKNDGKTTHFSYDTNGNLIKETGATYETDAQNKLTLKTDKNGKTSYKYDKNGNLIEETSKKGIKTYEYNSDNKLIRGTNEKGEISEYTYNALGVRVENKQTILNENMAYQTSDFKGSNNMDYMDFFKIGRATWQKTWKTNIGTIVQNPNPTVAKEYVPDYTTASKRDLMVYTLGESTARYVYAVNGERISAELEHAQGTKKGESGENIATDIAMGLGKIYYRMSHAGSTLYATDEKGEVLYHTEYDPWGNPQGKTKVNINFSGIENFNNFTGYTYDETLGIYYAQARFYNPEIKRFITEDPIKDGLNWYAYVGNNPVNNIDPSGLMNYFTQSDDLLKGAVAGITDAIVGTAKSLVQLPSIVVEIVKGVAMGEINIIDLAKSLVTSAFSDYTYIIKNISVLSFASKSNSQVYNFGKAVGGVAVDVGLSFFGAKGVSMVQDLLKGTKAGQKIISLLNSSSKYFDELTCPKIIQKHINSSADDLLRSADDVVRKSNGVISLTSRQTLKIENSVLGKPRVGSALKLDQYHAFNNIIDNYVEYAKKYNISNNGILYQIEGSLNGVDGRFEWITQGGNVTHRLFLEGKKITGVPNK